MASSQSGALRVRLSHAAGLRSMDSNGYSDPYTKLILGKKTHKSPTVKKSLNPRWDKDFLFPGNLNDLLTLQGGLKVQVWDYDFGSIRNDHLGEGSIDLRELMKLPHNLGSGRPVECSVQLKDSQATPGEVFLVLTWEGENATGSAAPLSCHSHAGTTGHHPHTPYTNGSTVGHALGRIPAQIAATFQQFDANHSGFLDYGELRPALSAYGLTVSERDAASMVRRYDDHPDGKIDMKEFAEMVRDLESGVIRREGTRHPYDTGHGVPARASATFDLFDRNRTGFLDFHELRNALQHYGIQASEPEAQQVVRAYDDNPDGKLDKTEFAAIVCDLEDGKLRREARTPRRPTGSCPSRYGGGYMNGGGYNPGGVGGRSAPSSPTRGPRYSGGDDWSRESHEYYPRCTERAWTEHLGSAGAYVVDILVRTAVYAAATAYIVAPQRLVDDANVAARAIGQDSAASLLGHVPWAVYIALLCALALILFAWMNFCGLRRCMDSLLSCVWCVRCCRACRGCTRTRPYDGRGGYGYDFDDEERGVHGRAPYSGGPHKHPLGRLSRDGRDTYGLY